MKLFLKVLIPALFVSLFLWAAASAVTILPGDQGGTGFGYGATSTCATGQFLTVSTTVGHLVWACTAGASSSTPALPYNSIQTNLNGAFGGYSNLLYDPTSTAIDLTSSSSTRPTLNLLGINNKGGLVEFWRNGNPDFSLYDYNGGSRFAFADNSFLAGGDDWSYYAPLGINYYNRPLYFPTLASSTAGIDSDLDITETAGVPGEDIYDPSSNPVFRVTTDSVGIGTLSPTTNLDDEGTFKAFNTSTIVSSTFTNSNINLNVAGPGTGYELSDKNSSEIGLIFEGNDGGFSLQGASPGLTSFGAGGDTSGMQFESFAPTTTITAQSAYPENIGYVVKGSPGQQADLQDWDLNGGTVLDGVSNLGTVYTNVTNTSFSGVTTFSNTTSPANITENVLSNATISPTANSSANYASVAALDTLSGGSGNTLTGAIIPAYARLELSGNYNIPNNNGAPVAGFYSDIKLNTTSVSSTAGFMNVWDDSHPAGSYANTYGAFFNGTTDTSTQNAYGVFINGPINATASNIGHAVKNAPVQLINSGNTGSCNLPGGVNPSCTVAVPAICTQATIGAQGTTAKSTSYSISGGNITIYGVTGDSETVNFQCFN